VQAGGPWLTTVPIRQEARPTRSSTAAKVWRSSVPQERIGMSRKTHRGIGDGVGRKVRAVVASCSVDRFLLATGFGHLLEDGSRLRTRSYALA
jgi:hypothetical protein